MWKRECGLDFTNENLGKFVFRLFERLVKDTADIGKTDRPPKKDNNNFSLLLLPLPVKDKPKVQKPQVVEQVLRSSAKN